MFPVSEEEDQDLMQARKELRHALGEGFEKYIRFMEAFLAGRLAKVELDLGLAALLSESQTRRTRWSHPSGVTGPPVDLHNAYIRRLLAKGSQIEARLKEDEALEANQTLQLATANLRPREVTGLMTKQEINQILEVLLKPVIVPSRDDGGPPHHGL